MDRICITLRNIFFEVLFRFFGQFCRLRTLVLVEGIPDYTPTLIEFCFKIVRGSVRDWYWVFLVRASRGQSILFVVSHVHRSPGPSLSL